MLTAERTEPCWANLFVFLPRIALQDRKIVLVSGAFSILLPIKKSRGTTLEVRYDILGNQVEQVNVESYYAKEATPGDQLV